MKLFPTIAGLFVLTVGTLAQPQQSGQAPPPPAQSKPAENEKEKTETKAPPSIAGKWNMGVETQQGTMSSLLDIKVEGKKVTGTVTGPQGEMAVQGEFAEGKLTFSLSFDGGSAGSMQIGFSGALKDDGTLAGTMDIGGQGMQIPWKAERVKDK
jgi:hypothetical protein